MFTKSNCIVINDWQGICKNISLRIYIMYSANINNHATMQEININYPSKQKVAKFSSATSN